MANVVVVGSQWGDEGKGKIVDWLSEQADIVVRFQGGHNAGHTLVINGTTYKLSLLPSGVVRPGKLSVIGNGVVLDPHALLNEIATLNKQGVTVTPDNLRIAENTPLILPLHQELDVVREKASGKGAIGTTGRGIGPAYEDKVGRPRRCGWFDAVLVRQTVRTSGIRGLALTKLDILDGFEEIKVCVAYRLDGKEIDYLPASEHAQTRVEPIYETIAGWREKTARARSWAELPAQAVKYVRRIEELIGCSAALLSTSPEREDTILMQNPFET